MNKADQPAGGKRVRESMIIDAFEFARRNEEASGTLAVRQLRRLGVVDSAACLDWRATGSVDERSRPFLDLKVDGSLQLVCQRCLQPLDVAVDLAARLLIAKNDAEADAVPLDEDGFDVVVGSGEFDLTTLVEDEVILWLPSAPRHDTCPASGGRDRADDAAQRTRVSPFAALGMIGKNEEA